MTPPTYASEVDRLDEGDGEQALLRELEQDVRTADRAVEGIVARSDRHGFLRTPEGEAFINELAGILCELEEAGIPELLTHAESIPLAVDNLPSVLEERGGIAALRRGLRLAIRVIREQLVRLDPDPWWGPVIPDFVVVAAEMSSTATFDQFVSHLVDDLEVLGNHPTLAVSASEIDDDHPLPVDAFGLVSNDLDTLRWAERNGLWPVRCEERDGGLVVSPLWQPGRDLRFHDPAEAAMAVTELLDSAGREDRDAAPPDSASSREDAGAASAGSFWISVEEHRMLETVVLEVVQQTEFLRLDPEDRELLQTALDTLQLQLRTSKPDRTIIGRAVRRIGTIAAVLAGGVAGNYLTDLVRRFPVPWP